MNYSRTASKLVVADVDGTVVSGNGVVSTAAVQAVAHAHAAGWHVVLATGRVVERVRPIATKLGLSFVICTEGSLIYSLAEERTLVARVVSPPVIAQAVATLEPESWPYGLATSQLFYARPPQFVHLFGPWTDSVEPLESRHADGEVLMLTVFGRYGEMQELYQLWQRDLGEEAQLVLEHTGAVPEGGLVKILSPHADKGQSALWLAEHLGFAGTDIIGLGDWLNDISLFDRAALSIAPANAIPEIKALADYVSPYGVEHDFFARELNRLLDEGAGDNQP